MENGLFCRLRMVDGDSRRSIRNNIIYIYVCPTSRGVNEPMLVFLGRGFVQILLSGVMTLFGTDIFVLAALIRTPCRRWRLSRLSAGFP